MKGVFAVSRSILTPQLWIVIVTILLIFGLPALLFKTHQFIAPARARANALPIINPISSLAVKEPDCAEAACLALTFDDGPNPIATPMVLGALEQAQVPATFFVVGSRAATLPDLLQREYHDGDEIGNHSWSHPDLTTLTPDQIISQVAQTQATVVAAGVPPPTLFRPPYGAINAEVISNVHLPLIFWNIDPKDWQTQNPAAITAAVEAAAKPGGIVEMHDIYTSTGAALPGLIANLKSRFTLVTVSQLLDLAPGQQGIFYSR